MELKRLNRLTAIGDGIGVIDTMSVMAKGAKLEHDTEHLGREIDIGSRIIEQQRIGTRRWIISMKKLGMNSLSKTDIYTHRPDRKSDRCTGTHEANRAHKAQVFYLKTCPPIFSLT